MDAMDGMDFVDRESLPCEGGGPGAGGAGILIF